MGAISVRRYWPKEAVSFLTHFLGLLFTFPAFYMLVHVASDQSRFIGATVYSVGLIIVYAGSAICHHGFGCSDERQDFLNRLDHAGIYIMIAATYTPLCLVILANASAYLLLAGVWAMAFAGAYFKIMRPWSPRWVTSLLYVVMGSLILLWLPALMQRLPPTGIELLLWGGICYMASAAIWAWQWPDIHDSFGHHEVMHLVVSTGSFLHYLMMIWFVIPRP